MHSLYFYAYLFTVRLKYRLVWYLLSVLSVDACTVRSRIVLWRLP